MELKSELHKTSFVIPDRPTVRQQMAYLSSAGGAKSAEYVEKLWEAAQTLITDWKSDLFPDASASLDSVSEARITNLIIWVSIEVKKHMDSLDVIEKK